MFTPRVRTGGDVMPRYRATIHKRSSVFNVAWSNVYEFDCLDVFNAMENASNTANVEAAVSYNTITFTGYRVVNVADKADARSAAITTLVGALDPTGLGGPLPLFCAIRVRFSDNVKKPEMKYLRLGANEANLTLGAWDGEFVSFVQTNYADVLLDNVQFVGPGGEHPTLATALAPVQNRQLGWHRRTRPGFKRGWVAV